MMILLLLFGNEAIFARKDSTLTGYLEQAALNNPELKASFLQYQAALQQVPQVGALPDPQASFGFFTKPMAITGGEQVAQINLMQMFPWFGTLKSAKAEASAMARARFDAFNTGKADLFYRVEANWYQLFKLKSEIRLVEENIELLESLGKLALIKFQSPPAGGSLSSGMSRSSGPTSSNNTLNNGMSGMSGQGANSPSGPTMSIPAMNSGMSNKEPGLQDVLRVKMEILEQRDKLEWLRDQLKTAKLSFNALLNSDPETEISLPDSLPQAELPAEQLALADSILQHNPMLAMLKNENESYTAMEDKAQKMGLPMWGVGVNYMLNQEREGNTFMMNGKDMIMPMVSVSIPIYRKKYRAMKDQAQLMQQASAQKTIDLQNKLLVQTQSLKNSLDDARRRIRLYREQEQLARTTTDLLLTGFSTTGNDYEEVLRMQSKVLDYGFKRIEALSDYNTSVALAEKLMNANSTTYNNESTENTYK